MRPIVTTKHLRVFEVAQSDKRLGVTRKVFTAIRVTTGREERRRPCFELVATCQADTWKEDGQRFCWVSGLSFPEADDTAEQLADLKEFLLGLRDHLGPMELDLFETEVLGDDFASRVSHSMADDCWNQLLMNELNQAPKARRKN